MNTVNQDEIVSFSSQVESIARDTNTSYIDAVVACCEQRQLEIEVAAKLISNSLKAKIRIEAESLNLVAKSNTARLPF